MLKGKTEAVNSDENGVENKQRMEYTTRFKEKKSQENITPENGYMTLKKSSRKYTEN